MASGTTLTVTTRQDLTYKAAVTATDAGSPSLGSPTFIYDDAETQAALISALDRLKLWVIENVKTTLPAS